jgi:chemotaxis protein histidine kinase CheA
MASNLTITSEHEEDPTGHSDPPISSPLNSGLPNYWEMSNMEQRCEIAHKKMENAQKETELARQETNIARQEISVLMEKLKIAEQKEENFAKRETELAKREEELAKREEELAKNQATVDDQHSRRSKRDEIFTDRERAHELKVSEFKKKEEEFREKEAMFERAAQEVHDLRNQCRQPYPNQGYNSPNAWYPAPLPVHPVHPVHPAPFPAHLAHLAHPAHPAHPAYSAYSADFPMLHPDQGATRPMPKIPPAYTVTGGIPPTFRPPPTFLDTMTKLGSNMPTGGNAIGFGYERITGDRGPKSATAFYTMHSDEDPVRIPRIHWKDAKKFYFRVCEYLLKKDYPNPTSDDITKYLSEAYEQTNGTGVHIMGVLTNALKMTNADQNDIDGFLHGLVTEANRPDLW